MTRRTATRGLRTGSGTERGNRAYNTERARRWRAANADRARLYSQERYQELKAVYQANGRAWRKANPDRIRAIQNNRRARVRNGGTFTVGEWRELVLAFDGRCRYCGHAGRLQADHRIPVSRGGMNTIDNIVPACGPCNSRKGAKTEAEYIAFILPLIEAELADLLAQADAIRTIGPSYLREAS